MEGVSSEGGGEPGQVKEGKGKGEAGNWRVQSSLCRHNRSFHKLPLPTQQVLTASVWTHHTKPLALGIGTLNMQCDCSEKRRHSTTSEPG